MLETTDLVTLGRSLQVDSDHPLYSINTGKLLLLNLRPQTYPQEVHTGVETIIVLSGTLSVETDAESVAVPQGQSISIPPGVEHRFGATSDAVILVLFGHAQA